MGARMQHQGIAQIMAFAEIGVDIALRQVGLDRTPAAEMKFVDIDAAHGDVLEAERFPQAIDEVGPGKVAIAGQGLRIGKTIDVIDRTEYRATHFNNPAYKQSLCFYEIRDQSDSFATEICVFAAGIFWRQA